MTLYRRNILVGAVVLSALVALAWMMTEFGGTLALPFAPKTIHVHFSSTQADGLSNGSPVRYRGVDVGHVEHVSRADDQLHVNIEATLEAAPPLPGNLSASIRSTGLIGNGTSVVLDLVGDQPQGMLKNDQQLTARFVGFDLIPPEVTELVGELRITVKQFHEANLVTHVDEQVLKVGKLLDSMHDVVGDEKLRDDLRASLANIRQTTEKSKQVADSFDKISSDFDKLSLTTTAAVNDISKQAAQRMTEVSAVLEKVQAITEKVNNGTGTAGLLVNDPKLYASLVDSARELSATVTDMKRLVEQWEQEGVTLKLK